MDPRPLAHPPGRRGRTREVSVAWVVRLPTWLGDAVMALPTLRALARAVEAPLLLWGKPALEEMCAQARFPYRYLPYRRRRGGAGFSDAIHACADLRHQQPDAALLLPNAFEPALLAFAARVPRRVGYATDGRGALLNDIVEEPAAPRHRVHEAERFATLARHVGAAVDPADNALSPDETLRARAASLLPAGGPYLGLAPGSANTPAKRWPVASWARLAGAARDDLGARVVLLGSAADRAVNAEIAGATAGEAFDLSGCSMSDLMAAMLRCRALVGNDSGAAHLAAALGRATLVLFGPTDPQRSAPGGKHVATLSAGSFCQPCGYRRCPLDHRCMHDLEPAAALAALDALWRQAA